MKSCSCSRRHLPVLTVSAMLLVHLSAALGPCGDVQPKSGDVTRNMVNTTDKNPPVEWDVKARKNVKWVAKIGTRGYTVPVVAGGKVFVSTNNRNPRDPKAKGDKAVLMCFRETDGQFLWQLVHDMPPREVIREAQQDG